MTWQYQWHNTPYDTQCWEYWRRRGSHGQKIGVVKRVIRARQSYDEPVHEYHAHAFGMKQKMVFLTRAEAEAWVTACERM